MGKERGARRLKQRLQRQQQLWMRQRQWRSSPPPPLPLQPPSQQQQHQQCRRPKAQPQSAWQATAAAKVISLRAAGGKAGAKPSARCHTLHQSQKRLQGNAPRQERREGMGRARGLMQQRHCPPPPRHSQCAPLGAQDAHLLQGARGRGQWGWVLHRVGDGCCRHRRGGHARRCCCPCPVAQGCAVRPLPPPLKPQPLWKREVRWGSRCCPRLAEFHAACPLPQLLLPLPLLLLQLPLLRRLMPL